MGRWWLGAGSEPTGRDLAAPISENASGTSARRWNQRELEGAGRLGPGRRQSPPPSPRTKGPASFL